MSKPKMSTTNEMIIAETVEGEAQNVDSKKMTAAKNVN